MGSWRESREGGREAVVDVFDEVVGGLFLVLEAQVAAGIVECCNGIVIYAVCRWC